MVAMFIAEQGFQKTEKIISGWVDNLATSRLSSDTKVIEAIILYTSNSGHHQFVEVKLFQQNKKEKKQKRGI